MNTEQLIHRTDSVWGCHWLSTSGEAYKRQPGKKVTQYPKFSPLTPSRPSDRFRETQEWISQPPSTSPWRSSSLPLWPMLTATKTAAATVEARMDLWSRLDPDFLHFWILTATQDIIANVGITQTEDITLESALVEPGTDWPITLLSMREASEPGPV